jgi:glucose-1-phosphate cytidylyltransferase
MKVIILAGGFGTRISEETENKPKPMVLLDDKPILWHLMNSFANQGFNDFVLALGYKGDVIKRWVIDLNELTGNILVNTLEKKISHLGFQRDIDWNVTALETGLHTQTGSRITRCMELFPNESTFIATYGDGLANVNIEKLLEFHQSHGKIATVTAVRPPARFGYMRINDNIVTHFGEKNQSDEGWINGGYFVLNKEIMRFDQGDKIPFETGIIAELVKSGELMAYHHEGFWQPMDTLRDRKILADLATSIKPPWLEF